MRNVLPTAQLYGLPRALGAAMTQRPDLYVTIDHASNFSADFAPGTGAFFDGETTVTTLSFRAPLASGIQQMELGVELPYVVHAGGFLDGFLESFHDLTGLPDGGRSEAPKNQLDYLLRHQGETYAQLDDRRRHVGDLRGWFGYQLHRSAIRTLGIRAQLKLPTGRVRDLSGSEGTDVALWLEYADRSLLDRYGLSFSLMGGAVHLGAGELAPDAQKDLAVVGHLGLQYALSPRIHLHAQLDGHSQLLDTGVPQAADGAIQGTLGGRWLISPRYWLSVGVIEDLRAQTASDVVFQLAMGTHF